MTNPLWRPLRVAADLLDLAGEAVAAVAIAIAIAPTVTALLLPDRPH